LPEGTRDDVQSVAPVHSRGGRLQGAAELLRVIALLEGQPAALLRRELFHLLPVLLDQGEEFCWKPGLELADRDGCLSFGWAV
jgi:hypothetical protein